MITKLVIPVAGLGTRFLPATKASPKEMMPVVDKPIIQYVVENAVKSGITDIILVTGPGKRSVEDHFSPNYELVSWLKKQGKAQAAEEVKKIADLANFIFVRQKGPYGNGTPVLCAKNIIGDEPFAVLWGDEFFINDKKPTLKQVIETFEKYGDPVLSAYEVSAEDTKKYGVIDGVKIEKDVYQIKNMVEKPGPQKAPSHFAILGGGGYVLTPDIFEALENTKVGQGGELWLTDAVFKLMKKRPVYARLVEGTYYDTGSKLGYLKANIDLALKEKVLGGELREYLKSVV
ncbi:MAG: UTP--glucose-1-phosphate uridylyltransferase GalU [Candidatus Magasanikbacteria bacterium]